MKDKLIRAVHHLEQLIQRLWVPLLAIAVAVVGTYAIVHFWDWLRGAEEDPNVVIRNVGLIVAAIVAIILAIWRSCIAENQTKTASRSLLDERYRAAVDMLGSDQLFVRVGAIDTLTQLAESNPTDFHLRVVRLLAAYVRYPKNENVRLLPYGAREEVQRILHFVATRSKESRRVEEKEGCIIDFQGADLSSIWLPRGACLARVRLSYCDLSGAVLDGVRGLTASRVLLVRSDPENPLSLKDTVDCETGQPLIVPSTPLR